jgi:hypothetical protein
MEATSKRTGKKFTGKVAALMVRLGAATPVEEEQDPVTEVVPEKEKRVYKPKAK